MFLFHICLFIAISVALGSKPGSRSPPIDWNLPAECNDQGGLMSSCMRTAHSGARQCVTLLQNDPKYQPCRNDTNYKSAIGVWFDLSHAWHESLGKCLLSSTELPVEDITERRVTEETDTSIPNTLVGRPSIPALECFEKSGMAVRKCNEEIMDKCQKYNKCYNRVDVAGLRGYKDEAAKKQAVAMSQCYRN